MRHNAEVEVKYGDEDNHMEESKVEEPPLT